MDQTVSQARRKVQRRQTWLVVVTILFVICWAAYEFANQDELAFLEQLHPRRIVLPSQADGSKSYALIFPKENADKVAGLLRRELLPKGWKEHPWKASDDGFYLERPNENPDQGYLSLVYVGIAEGSTRVNDTYTVEDGECEVGYGPRLNWLQKTVSVVKGWLHL